MRKPGNLVGLANIDKAISSIDKVAGNLADRIQDVAVAIVEHANGPGNGDVSRALNLVKVVNRRRILNSAFLIAWFRYFGNCNINLAANNGAGKVTLHARDSKAYRGGFDVAGAKANNWTDAFDADGNRAPWYTGPAPTAFTPMGIGDVADDFKNFVEREMKRLDGTKEVGGKVVPLFNLTDEDKAQARNALDFIARISATLARHENVQKLTEQLEQEKAALDTDEQVVEVIGAQPQEKMVA